MRYFKKTDNTTHDINVIAGEIINISFGRNYYVNGVLNRTPDMKTNYNTYDIDGVECEFHPNVGIIFLLCDSTTVDTMNVIIKQRVAEFERNLHTMHGFKKVSTGISGTTQYLLLEEASFTGSTNIGFFQPGSDFKNMSGNTADISWLITDDDNKIIMPSIVTEKYKDLIIYSLSSVIYDGMCLFDLPHGYRSPDYPDIHQTVSYTKNYIIKEPLYVSAYHGLYREIAKLHGVVKKEKKNTYDQYSDHTEFPTVRVLNWLKWEDIKPMGTEVSVLDPIERIKRGLLNTDETLTDESEELQKKVSKEFNVDIPQYKCIITGIPIYEDTYVFDVYQQIVEEVIDVNDFDKYPDAEIIPMEIIVIPESKTEIATEHKDLEPSDEEKDEDEDHYVSTKERRYKATLAKKKGVLAKKNAALAKKKLEAEKKLADDIKAANDLIKRKAAEKAAGMKSLTSTLQDVLVEGSTKKKMPLKRGQKKAVELIKIRRTIVYNTARHLLISPYYMHCMGIADPVKKFETDTGTKVLVFRTFSPRTLKNVIDSIPDLHPAHRQFLHEFNYNAEFKHYIIKTANVLLYKDMKNDYILDAYSSGKICGTFVVGK